MKRKVTSPGTPSLTFLVRDTARLLIHIWQVRAARHGTTLSENLIVRELLIEDGLTVQVLAKQLRIVSSRMTMTIQALQEKGFVKRVASKDDGRKVHVFLTAKGRTLADAFRTYGADIYDVFVAGIPESEIKQFRSVLERMRHNLESHVADGH